MTDEFATEPDGATTEMLLGMAAAVGVRLTGERAATLAPQAEQHFAQLRDLDAVANSCTEPAAEFRLDRWTVTGGD